MHLLIKTLSLSYEQASWHGTTLTYHLNEQLNEGHGGSFAAATLPFIQRLLSHLSILIPSIGVIMPKFQTSPLA